MVIILRFKCFNQFMYNVEKWGNILKKSCSVHTTRFSRFYVWPFFNIMNERIKVVPVSPLHRWNLSRLQATSKLILY